MSNYRMIYNTLYNSIKFFNNTDLLPSKTIHLDPSTGVVKLKSFYKMTGPKIICFDVFRIQNMLDEAGETIYNGKYAKYRTLIAKFVLSTLLEKYVIDKTKYKDKKEIREICYIESTRILANNFKKAKSIIGLLDITNDADVILNEKKLYLRDDR